MLIISVSCVTSTSIIQRRPPEEKTKFPLQRESLFIPRGQPGRRLPVAHRPPVEYTGVVLPGHRPPEEETGDLQPGRRLRRPPEEKDEESIDSDSDEDFQPRPKRTKQEHGLSAADNYRLPYTWLHPIYLI